MLRSFEAGWHASEDEPPNVRSLLRLSLLGAAMDACNAVRDGKCLRYRKDWEGLKFGGKDVVEALRNRVAVIAEDLKNTASADGSRIVRGDCRQRLSQDFEPFDVCVTSPPYLNSFDYSDVYRPELFLGKFVDSNEALRVVRLRTLRSHVQVEWPKPTLDDFGTLYRSRIEKLRSVSKELWSQRIPLMVQAYFEDMTQVLLSLRRLAKPDASLWLVVSTSAYAGVEIPVDLILAEIGMRSGWFLREVGVLRYLRTSGQHWNRWEALAGEKPQLRESVVILDAKPRGRGKRASGK
ncbi:hypothetical protein [Nannocystis sp.]|uniref:hypothetical protein n=1 Tax=Nannocystis sp. TaxID=1962667 RepID=UPI0025F29A23|nr:hypothetical protein [Nannocystis sp.]